MKHKRRRHDEATSNVQALKTVNGEVGPEFPLIFHPCHTLLGACAMKHKRRRPPQPGVLIHPFGAIQWRRGKSISNITGFQSGRRRRRTAISHPCHTLREEHGSILILAALLIFTISMFMALVIDSARLASASRQKSQTADFLAQSFLQSYFAYLVTLDGALTESNQILAYHQGLDAATGTGRLNFQSSSKMTSGREDESRQVTDPSEFFTGHINAPGKRGFVQTGMWFYDKPKALENICTDAYSIDFTDPANRCPCVTPEPNRPFGCFVACDNARGCQDPFDPQNSEKRLPPNAAKVTLKTDDDSSDGITTTVKNIFGGAGENRETKISRSGIAVLTPRRTVLLLDLSRSTTAETHYQWQKSALRSEPPSEYAYKCLNHHCMTVRDPRDSYGQCTGGSNGAPDVSYGVNSIDPAPSVPNFTLDSGERPLSVPHFKGRYQQSYESLDPGPRVTQKFFPTKPRIPLPFCPLSDRQCKRQYQCAEVDTDGDGNGESEEVFLIDSGFNADGEPKLAQPHTNILATAHEIVKTLYDRRIVGDLVGFIGYGQSVDTKPDPSSPNPRTYKKTNRYIPPTPLFMSETPAWAQWEGASDFRKIYDFTDPDPERRVWRAKRNIFPRPEEFTDLPLALWHAQNMLMQIPGSESADNSIILVGSGLTNCRRGSVTDRELPEGKTPICGRRFEAHQSSLQEMFYYRVAGSSQWRLESKRIKLHAALVGSKVTPHSIAIHKYGSEPSRCLTERELRSRNLSTTLPPSTYEEAQSSYEGVGSGNLAPTTTYSGSAHWIASAARQLGGLWIPIRMDVERCGDAPACDNDGSIEPELNAACDYQRMPEPPNPDTGKYPPANSTEKFPEASASYNIDGHLEPGWLNYTNSSVPADEEGRIFCDPKCREREPGTKGVELQVEEALSDFYKLPQIALVDEPQYRAESSTND